MLYRRRSIRVLPTRRAIAAYKYRIGVTSQHTLERTRILTDSAVPIAIRPFDVNEALRWTLKRGVGFVIWLVYFHTSTIALMFINVNNYGIVISDHRRTGRSVAIPGRSLKWPYIAHDVASSFFGLILADISGWRAPIARW